MISVEIKVECSKCHKKATLSEDAAEFTGDWALVTLSPPRRREHNIMGRPKQTCLCATCAMATFPDLYPMEAVAAG